MTIQEILTNTPANAFQLQEKRPGTFQLIAPIFHDDGDMVSIYLEKASDDAISGGSSAIATNQEVKSNVDLYTAKYIRLYIKADSSSNQQLGLTSISLNFEK